MPNFKDVDEAEERIEEERRVAFVGITRAKLCVYISNYKSKEEYFGYYRPMPSMFIHEVAKWF